MITTLIVDGYNIIHAIPELERACDRSLEHARLALEELLRVYQRSARSIERIYVIYDSKGPLGYQMEDHGLVKKIFVHAKQNADGEIVALLKNATSPARIAVLSEDNFVINHTRTMGARLLPLEEFIRKVSRPHTPKRSSSLDRDTIHEINRELRKHYGID